MTSPEAAFTIPARPQRRYPYEGGVEYEGEVVFSLEPAGEGGDADMACDDEESETDTCPGDDRLEDLVTDVLSDGPYQFGDFLELPMVLYLVRDRETRDAFRVSIRDGIVRLHVLPNTESDGLRRFYDRLVDRTGWEWRIDRRTDLD